MRNRKTYRELITFSTFQERYEYLRLRGIVGDSTFGHSRYLNQKFYTSKEWRDLRREVILRDNGCDLGIKDRPIFGRVIVHHINPLKDSDIIEHSDSLFDLDNLICVSEMTDRAIHFGDFSLTLRDPIERKKGDTLLWKSQS